MDEAQIFTGLKTGDKHAYDKLFDLLYPQVHFFIEKLIKDEDEAKDIAMLALAKFWEKGADDFPTFPHIRKFIFTVARNIAYNHLKKLKVREAHHKHIIYLSSAEENNQIEQNLYRIEMLEALANEVENLPGQCREAFKMVFIDNMPRPLVAQKLNITAGTVNVHCSNAMKRLKQIFSDRQLIALLALVGACYN